MRYATAWWSQLFLFFITSCNILLFCPLQFKKSRSILVHIVFPALKIFTIDSRYFFLAVKSWDVPSPCRAAVLERMPVIEKNSPGHTNGESTGEAVKDIQPPKVKQGEALLPQPPANQVRYVDTRYMTVTWAEDLCVGFPIPFLCIWPLFAGHLLTFKILLMTFQASSAQAPN